MNMRRILTGAAVLCLMTLGFMVRPAHAAEGEFSLQVYPSPLVATVKPAESSSLELKIRNTGTAPEDLTVVPRAFKIDSKTQQLEISTDQVPDIASWITFGAPRFTIQPGQTFTENITLKIPANAGFSYAFSFVIKRTSQVTADSGRTLQPTVAVFALINVDRPGAVRSLEVTRFAANKGTYDYLPASFDIDFKNTGNTIVQPSGNVFIQRGSDDANPITTLPVNQSAGYILPGTTRTLTVAWDDGFQVITKKPQSNGTQKEELSWNWNKLSSIRFGKYTAKLVAVYDDGHRDIPLQAETTFWVFPWQMLLGVLAIAALVGAGVWSVVRSIVRGARNIGGGRKKMKL